MIVKFLYTNKEHQLRTSVFQELYLYINTHTRQANYKEKLNEKSLTNFMWVEKPEEQTFLRYFRAWLKKNKRPLELHFHLR